VGTELAGPEFVGLDRFEARKKVVAMMEELDLLEKIEDYTIQTPISNVPSISNWGTVLHDDWRLCFGTNRSHNLG